MHEHVRAGLDRLTERLPLKARQDALPPELAALHRAVLQGLMERGRAPGREEMAAIVGGDGVDAAVARLAADDLVVTADGRVIGAYPMTEADTPHRVRIGERAVHAMCALDALSVAPMYGLETVIESRCHTTATPITLHQKVETIVSADPGADVMVGIRWQSPGSCAAASLCLEMVYLRDPDTAAAWRAQDPENIDLYDLDQAVAFGAAFFRPLLGA